MNLLPPLVHAIRREVKAWRESGYSGASRTTRALLLRRWFQVEHIIPQADGSASRFRWYFAQREAVESAIWLFEVAKARDAHSLTRFDSSGAVSRNIFLADWTRYVLKLATGAGTGRGFSSMIRSCRTTATRGRTGRTISSSRFISRTRSVTSGSTVAVSRRRGHDRLLPRAEAHLLACSLELVLCMRAFGVHRTNDVHPLQSMLGACLLNPGAVGF
jgi:hypothetical protein